MNAVSDSLTTNFPQYDTPFIGRDDDTTAISDLLADPAVRWLSLIGASGTGKTRLALHVAEQIAQQFPGGLFFISFAAITNDEYILSTIAQGLGIHENSGIELVDALVNSLTNQTLLLILDNVEQIPSLAITITPLLERTDNVKFLITSQQPTKQAHETIYHVPSLGIPESHEHLSLEELLRYPAIALFVDRFQTHQPDFVLSKNNAQYVVEICKRVRGLPLALELISACSTSLSVADLVFLLKNYLAIGQWATNSRDRILSPVLDWCYSRLSVDCQIVLSVFGVFVGGCTLESMHRICHAIYPAINVDEALATLTDRHLILLETQPNHTPRYIMLDAIVEYTVRLFNKLKQRKELLEAHKSYFVNFAEEGYPEFAGPDQSNWNISFMAEQHNFRVVLQRIHSGILPKRQGTAIQLCGALARFWFHQGQFSEGLALSERALHEDQADTLLTARLYQGIGILVYGKTDFEQAKQYYLHALSLREQLGDEAGVAKLQSNLSLIAIIEQNYAEAKALLLPTLTIWHKLGRIWDEGQTYNSLGIIAVEEEEYDQAFEYYSKSLEISKQLNDPIGTGNALSNLGEIALNQNNYDLAKQQYEQALEYFVVAQNKFDIPFALANLGYIALKQNDIPNAERYFLQAGELQSEVGEWTGNINVFEGFAHLKGAQHQFESATKLIGFVDALRTRLTLLRFRGELELYNQLTNTLHAHVDAERFEQLHQEGATWNEARVLQEMGISPAEPTG